jgi:hypothetical protein
MFGFGDDPEVPEPPERPGALGYILNLYEDVPAATSDGAHEYSDYTEGCIEWSVELKKFHSMEVSPDQAEKYMEMAQGADAQDAVKHLKDMISIDKSLSEGDFTFPVDSIEELKVADSPNNDPANDLDKGPLDHLKGWLKNTFSDAHDNVQPDPGPGQEQTMIAKPEVPGMNGLA